MKLAYRQLSEGPPLIIIHGLYGSSDNWFSIGKELQDHFGVYLIDQRNHGNSPRHPEHTYPRMRDDLLEFLDEHNLYKVYLLGHSMGGKTALYFASRYAERMAGLIVADISPFGYTADGEGGQLEMHQQILEALLSVDPSRLQDRKEANDQLGKYISSERVRQFLLKNLHRNKQKEYEWKIDARILKDNLPEILKGLPRPGEEGFQRLNGYPVLFLRGGKSPYIPESHLPLIRQLAPYSEIADIPQAGHWLHAENPKAFLQAVKDTFID